MWLTSCVRHYWHLLHTLLWETALDGSKKQYSRVTPSPATLEEKKASSGLMETKIIFFPGRYDSIRDRQLILERPWKEARSPGQAVAVGTEHKDPQVPKEDKRGFLWEPGSTVLFWSATNCDSFTVSVRAAGFLWEVTRTLISLISL